MVIEPDAYEIRLFYLPDEDRDCCYLAVVAEMPEVSAFGSTREAALCEIQVALRLVLSTYVLDNELPPPPLYGRACPSRLSEDVVAANESAKQARFAAQKRAAARKPKLDKKGTVPNRKSGRALATASTPKKKSVSTAAPTSVPEHSSARVRVEENERIAA